MSEPAAAAAAPRRAPRPIWLGRGSSLVAAVLLVLYPMLSDNLYYQNMIILSLVFAIAASGLSIITGLAGYVSLGQGAFIGLGGYTVGVLATQHPDTSVWLWMPLCRRGRRAGRARSSASSRCARAARRS